MSKFLAQKQMHMIRLDSQLEQLLGVFFDHLLNDLFQAVVNRADEHLAPSFGAPDKVVDHQVNIMAYLLILHVAILSSINVWHKFHPTLSTS